MANLVILESVSSTFCTFYFTCSCILCLAVFRQCDGNFIHISISVLSFAIIPRRFLNAIIWDVRQRPNLNSNKLDTRYKNSVCCNLRTKLTSMLDSTVRKIHGVLSREFSFVVSSRNIQYRWLHQCKVKPKVIFNSVLATIINYVQQISPTDYVDSCLIFFPFWHRKVNNGR